MWKVKQKVGVSHVSSPTSDHGSHRETVILWCFHLSVFILWFVRTPQKLQTVNFLLNVSVWTLQWNKLTKETDRMFDTRGSVTAGTEDMPVFMVTADRRPMEIMHVIVYKMMAQAPSSGCGLWATLSLDESQSSLLLLIIIIRAAAGWAVDLLCYSDRWVCELCRDENEEHPGDLSGDLLHSDRTGYVWFIHMSDSVDFIYIYLNIYIYTYKHRVFTVKQRELWRDCCCDLLLCKWNWIQKLNSPCVSERYWKCWIGSIHSEWDRWWVRLLAVGLNHN